MSVEGEGAEYDVEMAKKIFDTNNDQDRDEEKQTDDAGLSNTQDNVAKNGEFDPFKGIKFPKLCDVLDCLRQSNFLPLLALMQVCPELDLSKLDIYGFSPVHYAVARGNIQAIEIIYEARPESLTYLSKMWQTPLMLACGACNPQMFYFIASRISSMRLNEKDNWGFNPLTYCIKSNFISGFFYLLYKKAKFDRQYTDRLGNGYAHWAAKNDRRTLLEFLFRAGVDFKKTNKNSESSFEVGLKNWSLHSLVFLLQNSMQPLDTYRLMPVGNEFMLELTPHYQPEDLRVMQSNYIPQQLRRIETAHKITGGNMNGAISVKNGIDFVLSNGWEGFLFLWKRFSNRRIVVVGGLGAVRPITGLLLLALVVSMLGYVLASTGYFSLFTIFFQLALICLLLIGTFKLTQTSTQEG